MVVRDRLLHAGQMDQDDFDVRRLVQNFASVGEMFRLGNVGRDIFWAERKGNERLPQLSVTGENEGAKCLFQTLQIHDKPPEAKRDLPLTI